MGKKIVQIEVDDELVDTYFEGLDEVRDSDARTAVREIFDAGLANTLSQARRYESDAYRRVTTSEVGDGDGTACEGRTVGSDSGASSSGLETTEDAFRLD